MNSIKLIEVFLDGIGKFKKFTIKFKKQVTYLYGLNGSGKTTVGFFAPWACIEGIVQKLTSGKGMIADRSQIIAGKSGDLACRFELPTGEKFTVENHVTQTGNNIKIIPDKGVQIDDSILSKLFNPALMSAKYFCNLSAKEQALVLGIDTKEHDKKIAALKQEFTGLNRDMKNILPVAKCDPVEPVSVQELTDKKKVVSSELNQKYIDNREYNKKLRNEYDRKKHNYEVMKNALENKNIELLSKIESAKEALKVLVDCGYKGVEVGFFIDYMPVPTPIESFNEPEPAYIEEMPNRTPIDEIDTQISSAYEVNQKAENYAKYMAYLKSVDSKQREIDANKLKQVEAQESRLKYINSFDFGFSGLTTNEDGDLRLNDREIREPYYSGAELEIIVAKLYSSLNPDFKYRFIDEFGRFDSANKKKIVDTLLADGFQLIIAVPDEDAGDNTDNAVILRECKILTEDNDKPELI